MESIEDILGGAVDLEGAPIADGERRLLDPGWYTWEVKSVDIVPTKRGDGYYLAVELGILSDEISNWDFTDRITISNSNQMAVEIGERKRNALFLAAGFSHISNEAMQEIIGKHVQGRIKIREPKPSSPGNDFGPSNEINAYKEVGKITPRKPSSNSSTPSPDSSGDGDETPPWM